MKAKIKPYEEIKDRSYKVELENGSYCEGFIGKHNKGGGTTENLTKTDYPLLYRYYDDEWEKVVHHKWLDFDSPEQELDFLLGIERGDDE